MCDSLGGLGVAEYMFDSLGGADSGFGVELLCTLLGSSRAMRSRMPAKRLSLAGNSETSVSGILPFPVSSVSICIRSATLAVASREEILAGISGASCVAADVVFAFFALFLPVEPSSAISASVMPEAVSEIFPAPSNDCLGVLIFFGGG